MHAQNISLAVAFGAGALSFFSPCVLPLIPSYIMYITGLSFHDIQTPSSDGGARRKIFFHSLCFVLGFSVIFAALGASATLAGSLLQNHAGLIRKTGGVLIALFGAHVTGLIPCKWLLGEKKITLLNSPSGYAGSFLVGIVFAAGWTPCIGPVLASILIVAATEEKIAYGVALLAAYSLGLGIPFILSALAMRSFLILFNHFKRFIRMFEIIAGIFLMALGMALFWNWFPRIIGYFSVQLF